MRLYTDEASAQTLEVLEVRHDGQTVFRNTEGKYETRITCSPQAFFIEPKRMLEPRPVGFAIRARRPLIEQITEPQVVDLRAQMDRFFKGRAA